MKAENLFSWGGNYGGRAIQLYKLCSGDMIR